MFAMTLPVEQKGQNRFAGGWKKRSEKKARHASEPRPRGFAVLASDFATKGR
jgi:hypothetical protein